MAHFPDYEILSCGNFYQYDGELYANHFPHEWAQNHMDGTGPKSCNNCRYFGSWNGVFVGYCANCAHYDYEFSRGHGFIAPGRELRENIPQARAMETYLCEVDFNTIGDKDLFDSAAVLMDADDDDDMLSEASDYDGYESNDELNTATIMEDGELSFTIDRTPTYE